MQKTFRFMISSPGDQANPKTLLHKLGWYTVYSLLVTVSPATRYTQRLLLGSLVDCKTENFDYVMPNRVIGSFNSCAANRNNPSSVSAERGFADRCDSSCVHSNDVAVVQLHV
jgi:hypothetical protein